MAAASRNIDSSASPDEWKSLYEWVEERTLAFEHPSGGEPWLMPDNSREQIIKRIHSANDGGWMGMGGY